MALTQQLFQKNLSDLIKGIRSNKKNEAQFISKMLTEIKQELKSKEIDVKVIAIQKLTFLQMMGYDMKWAAFNVLEVMSHSKFALKRIGYLAASQSFDQDTDVLLLTTNQFKKDMTGGNQYEIGVAMNALANIVTPDLGRDLVSDVASLLGNSHSYVRKKAVLLLYKIFLQYPEALRPSFPRLKEKFEDASQPVVTALVNVICELARKNPQNYTSLARPLHTLLTTTSNNWLLIKVIKLFGALCPHEPRLPKKLVDPLTNIINTTPAKSVMYEAICTCTIGLSQYTGVIKLCAEKLAELLNDADPNLKYLGLLGLPGVMRTHPKLVREHKDTILKCLEDDDVTIRLRALDLLDGITGKKNLKDVIRRMMELTQLAEGEYRDKLITKMVALCSEEGYARVNDFEWYITVLMDLARLPAMQQGRLVCSQVLDIAVRVPTLRPSACSRMLSLIVDPAVVTDVGALSNAYEVLYGAAYVLGEFSSVLDKEDYVRAVKALLQDRASSVPAHIQAVFAQNALKLYARAVESQRDGQIDQTMLQQVRKVVDDGLNDLAQSSHVEVQERACSSQKLIALVDQLAQGGRSFPLASLFDEELNPVAVKAQRKVPVPDGLDLDAWINEEPRTPHPSDNESDDLGLITRTDRPKKTRKGKKHHGDESDSEDSDLQREQLAEAARKRQEERRAADPYYLKSTTVISVPDDQDIPIQVLQPKDLGLATEDIGSGKRSRHGKHKAPAPTKHAVRMIEEMPEGFTPDAPTPIKRDATADALNVDIMAPLRDTDILPSIQRYPHKTEAKAAPVKVEEPKAEEGKHRHRHKHGDKHKSSKHGKEEKEGRSSKHRSSKKETATTAAPVATPAAPAQSNLLIDLGFDMAPSPTPQQYASLSTPTGSPSAGTPTTTTAVAAPAAATAAAPKAEKERSHRSHRDKESGHRHRSHRDKSEAVPAPLSIPATAVPASVSTPTAAAPGTPLQPLRVVARKKVAVAGKDDNALVSYTLSASVDSPKVITAALTVKNLSADYSLEKVSLDTSDTLNIQLARPGKGQPVAIPEEVEALSDAKQSVPFNFSLYTRPQKLAGFLNYTLGGREVKLPLTFNFGCAAFVVPMGVPHGDFQAALESGAASSGAAVRVPRGSKSWKEFEDALMLTLNVVLIESGSEASALFGRTTQQHAVAVVAKCVEEQVKVDIKTKDDGLAASLAQEVTSVFGHL
eukprot:TRINITY_DN15571_c0_g1_i1.p1 TRINITY_DN15571_c0_g1~~TRINITY_DN15571_c0_g1_i1.p1  ORF type:complete len:1203 (-),score=311.42 TRINITY_DN15571_c0_g1_i1:35-3643(-)